MTTPRSTRCADRRQWRHHEHLTRHHRQRAEQRSQHIRDRTHPSHVLDGRRYGLFSRVRRPVLGHLHPITQTIEELKEIMGRLGFTVAEGPEIEDEGRAGGNGVARRRVRWGRLAERPGAAPVAGRGTLRGRAHALARRAAAPAEAARIFRRA